MHEISLSPFSYLHSIKLKLRFLLSTIFRNLKNWLYRSCASNFKLFLPVWNLHLSFLFIEESVKSSPDTRFTFYNIQKYRRKILPLLKSQYHNIGMAIFFHHPHFFRIQSWSRNKFYSQQLNKKLNFLTLITPNIIIILLQYSTNKAWNIQPPEEILQNPSNLLNQAEYPNQQQQATFNKSFSTRGDHHPSSNGREHPDSITPFPSSNRFIDPAKDKKKTEQIEKETKKERRGEIPRSILLLLSFQNKANYRREAGGGWFYRDTGYISPRSFEREAQREKRKDGGESLTREVENSDTTDADIACIRRIFSWITLLRREYR